MRVSLAFRKYLNIPFGTPDFSLGTPLGNIGLDQRSPSFFARRPHRLLHNSSRAGRLCNVTVSCYVTFHQIKTCFVNIFFHDWQNVFRSDKMASRAGFGRRAVVWRPFKKCPGQQKSTAAVSNSWFAYYLSWLHSELQYWQGIYAQTNIRINTASGTDAPCDIFFYCSRMLDAFYFKFKLRPVGKFFHKIVSRQ